MKKEQVRFIDTHRVISEKNELKENRRLSDLKDPKKKVYHTYVCFLVYFFRREDTSQPTDEADLITEDYKFYINRKI